MANVPGIDQDTGKNEAVPTQYSEFNLRVLDAEAREKEKINREADQRYWLRFVSVFVAIAILIGMGIVLICVSKEALPPSYVKSHPVYIVSVSIGPVVSMTTITIALLFAAFRGFKNADPELAIDPVSAGARIGGAQ